MKTFKFIFMSLTAGLTFSCKNEPPSPTAPGVESTYIQNTDSVDKTFTEDVDRLRMRINQRIAEIDANIQKSIDERKAEKNAKKQRNYDERINKWNARKAQFRVRLNELEKQTKTGWQKFKTDVEDFFNRD